MAEQPTQDDVVGEEEEMDEDAKSRSFVAEAPAIMASIFQLADPNHDTAPDVDETLALTVRPFFSA